MGQQFMIIEYSFILFFITNFVRFRIAAVGGKSFPFSYVCSHNSRVGGSYTSFRRSNLSRSGSLVFIKHLSTAATCFARQNVSHVAMDNLSSNNNLSSNDNVGNPLFSFIPSSFQRDKAFLYVFLNVNDIYNYSLFSNKVSSTITLNHRYHVLIKVRFSVDSFAMCGNQHAFDYSHIDDLRDLSDVVESRLMDFYHVYKTTSEDIVYVQLAFRKVNTVLLSEFSLDKDVNKHITYAVSKDIDGLSKIPVSVNETFIGRPLKTDLDDKGYIINIHLLFKNVMINFLSVIRKNALLLGVKHPDYNISFDDSYKFYLLKDKKSDHVLGIKFLNNTTIDNICYSLTGTVISHVTYTLIDDNTISRKSGNNMMVIKDNIIIESRQDINLKPISKLKSKSLHIENPNIGVIDCETFTDIDGINKIYALGFKTNLDDGVIYYINSVINTEWVVLQLVNELLRSKYDNINFYCHNLGGFDIFFILKVLCDYNTKYSSKNPQNYSTLSCEASSGCKEKESESLSLIIHPPLRDSEDVSYENGLYGISCIFRDDVIIKVTITKKINNKKRSFSICDSYCMLNSKLSKLASNFQVETQKGLFPYKFSNAANLFYVGNTPDIYYYDDISHKDYESPLRESSNWSFKDE
jgi:hypothetical protein